MTSVHTPRAAPSKLFWSLYDSVMSAARGWQVGSLRWELRAPLTIDGESWNVRAVIELGASCRGRGWGAHSQVWIGRPGSDAVPEGALSTLLSGRGYWIGDGGDWAARSLRLPSTNLVAERRFLTGLLGFKDPVSRVLSVEGLAEGVALFRGRRAGRWTPAGAQYALMRPVRTPGHQTEASLMVHLFEDSTPKSGRAAGLIAASSITIWPPWNGRGRLPDWIEKLRPALARQYRSVGHKAEWDRGPSQRGVMINSFREGLPGIQGVDEERRRLEGLRLGQPGLEPLDVTGRTIRPRAVVRVLSVPPLDGMAPAARRESEQVFARLVGRYVRVDDVDERGLVGAWVSIGEGKRRKRHWVALEPWLLRVRRTRPARR